MSIIMKGVRRRNSLDFLLDLAIVTPSLLLFLVYCDFLVFSLFPLSSFVLHSCCDHCTTARSNHLLSFTEVGPRRLTSAHRDAGLPWD